MISIEHIDFTKPLGRLAALPVVKYENIYYI